MRVCLLLEDEDVPQWQADALSTLFSDANVELTTVVYNERDWDRSLREAVERGVELREWTPVALLTKLLGRPVPQTETVAVESAVDVGAAKALHVEPAVVDGWKLRIPEETVETVAAHADVAIRFGFGFLVGPILSELEHGVLSYHHGDLREYRGQPMGFWEFVHGEDTAGITVQQLTEQLDAGRIAAVRTVPIHDLHTWGAVRRRLFDASDRMLVEAVETLRDGTLREPESLGDCYTLPRGSAVAKYAVKNATGYLRESLSVTHG